MEKKEYMEPQMKMWLMTEPLMQIGSEPNGDNPITDPDEELAKEVDDFQSGSTSVWDD